jgi:ubiquinone/menaquinone biosynthesis C-methylase UbiE
MNSSTWSSFVKIEAQHPWYIARRELLLDWAKKIEPGSFGIELGCGTGLSSEALMSRFKGVEVLATDVQSEGLALARNRGLKVQELDAAHEASWPNQEFDFAIAMDVLEHIERDDLAVENLYSHLRSSASVFITVPSFRFLWSKHDSENQHYRRYVISEIVHLCEKGGLKIEKIRYWNSFFLLPIFISRKWKDRFAPSHQDVEGSLRMPRRITSKVISLVYWIENKCGFFTGKIPGASIIIHAKRV